MDALGTYRAARADFVQRGEILRALGRRIGDVGHALASEPDNFSFGGVEPKLPPVDRSHRCLCVDAIEWRTAEEIQTMLAEWHAAKAAMLAAWEAIPPADRSIVQPPPK